GDVAGRLREIERAMPDEQPVPEWPEDEVDGVPDVDTGGQVAPEGATFCAAVPGGGTATAGMSGPELAVRRSAQLPARHLAARSGRWTACGASRLPGSGHPPACGPARSTSPHTHNPALVASC